MLGTTEEKIAEAIIRYLGTTENGSATIRQIRENLPKFVELNAYDVRPSKTRDGEKMWEQIVRNVVCHRNVSENTVHDGMLVYIRRGRLTLPDLDE